MVVAPGVREHAPREHFYWKDIHFTNIFEDYVQVPALMGLTHLG